MGAKFECFIFGVESLLDMNNNLIALFTLKLESKYKILDLERVLARSQKGQVGPNFIILIFGMSRIRVLQINLIALFPLKL